MQIEELTQLGSQKVYRNEFLNEISFPLGGIGTGSIGLSGRGSLRDFEIFNRPNIGSWYRKTYSAIRTQIADQEPVCRILEGPIPRPYTPLDGGQFHCNGEGLPHMDAVEFRGEYPFAWLEFQSAKLPVIVYLEAYNPFIPSDPDASSIPCAVFHYHVTNPGPETVHVSIMLSLLNLIGTRPENLRTGFESVSAGAFQNDFVQKDQLTGIIFTNDQYSQTDPKFGSMTLLTPNQTVTATSYWKQVPWFTPQGHLWSFFKEHGYLEEFNEKAIDHNTPDAGVICIEEDLEPGEKKTFTFYMTWHFPNFEKYWGSIASKGQIWQNYYATLYSDALDVGVQLAQKESKFYADSMRFHDALFTSSYPPYVIDAIASNMAILKTATCLRLPNGSFYGWEGCNNFEGCCEGTCAHVWNYQQALPFLFPQLERSIHEIDFEYNFLMEDVGALEFRTQLPLGSGHAFATPAADGQMGRLINMYREWKISGDTDWLIHNWPSVKRALEFAFEDWDEDKHGVLQNYQHNTYDIEFYGPTMMLTCYYLGALRAGAEMAKAAGDLTSAEEYMRIFTEGESYCDSKLFNGEYYIQLPPSLNKAPLNQLGPGCLIDQLVGLEISRIAGLPNFLDNDHVKSALQSIFKYNFKPNMREHENYARLYAVNDEAAVIICTWPHGGRPEVPFPYADEVMNGFEYQFGVHCIIEGLIEEGLTVVKSIRDRFDGFGRNPWDEFECGHHYARSMASYGLLIALSGFQFDKNAGFIGFSPILNQPEFRTFWSLDNVWGTYSQTIESARLQILYGTLQLNRIKLNDFKTKNLMIKYGEQTWESASSEEGLIELPDSLSLKVDDIVEFIVQNSSE